MQKMIKILAAGTGKQHLHGTVTSYLVIWMGCITYTLVPLPGTLKNPITNGSIQTCSTLAGDVGDEADAMEGGEGEGDTCRP